MGNLLLQNGPLKLSAYLHLPASPGPHPAILIIHGYRGNKVGYRRRFVHLAESLQRAGIATLRLDLRACGDSEGVFSSLTFGDWVSDALLALRFLEQHPDISKIGLLGSSLGGAVAIRCAHAFPIASIALWAAIADGALWYREWKGSQEQLENHLRCGEEGIPEELNREIRTIRSDLEVSQLPTIPLFCAHGASDTTVLPSHQTAYQKARSDNSLDDFLLLPNSDHRFSHDGERAQLIEATTRWLVALNG